MEVKVEDLLAQMLIGAEEVLHEAGAALVGGHSSEGAELALGFAINGLVDPQYYLRKGGMQPGDRLILTKALGTGTLFAADMRQRAKGRWITAALASMLQSNRAAAQCLRCYQATACTDVTGFGLLGHLVEMTKASDVDVELDLAQLPVLDGAAETVATGIFSSLSRKTCACVGPFVISTWSAKRHYIRCCSTRRPPVACWPVCRRSVPKPVSASSKPVAMTGQPLSALCGRNPSTGNPSPSWAHDAAWALSSALTWRARPAAQHTT